MNFTHHVIVFLADANTMRDPPITINVKRIDSTRRRICCMTPTDNPWVVKVGGVSDVPGVGVVVDILG